MPLRRGPKQRKLGFYTLTVHVCDWGCPDETSAPAVWTPGCPTLSPWCPLLCKGSVPVHSLLPGAPRAQPAAAPGATCTECIPQHMAKAHLTASPWDCWLKVSRTVSYTALQFSWHFQQDKLNSTHRYHPQVSHSNSHLYEQHALS